MSNTPSKPERPNSPISNHIQRTFYTMTKSCSWSIRRRIVSFTLIFLGSVVVAATFFKEPDPNVSSIVNTCLWMISSVVACYVTLPVVEDVKKMKLNGNGNGNGNGNHK